MKRLAFAAVCLFLAPIAAQAAQAPYRFELTPSIGYRFGGTLRARDVSFATTDLKVKDDASYGLTFDIPLSRSLQLELLANHEPTKLRVDNGLFGGAQDLANLDVDYFHVGVLAQWGDRRVEPFFTASAGVTHLVPGVPNTSSENRFSASLGGGVKVFFSDNIGMRFEARGFWTDISRYNGYYSNYYRDTSDFSQGLASIGLIFAW